MKQEIKNTATKEGQEVLEITKREWRIEKPIKGEYKYFSTVKRSIGGIYSNNETIPSEIVCNAYGATAEQAEQTAKAICTAVNNTYGKGYNPAAMEELYKALAEIVEEKEQDIRAYKQLSGETLELDPLIKSAKTALTNAKL